MSTKKSISAPCPTCGRRSPGRKPQDVSWWDGRALRAARAYQEWSQGDLADMIGISQGTIGSWERGHSAPGRDQLKALEKLFGEKLL